MATIATKPAPAGIDPALVLDYDFYADRRFNQPGGIPAAMIELRDAAPDVFWSTALGGFWVVQGYDALIDAAKRPNLFSSSEMRLPPQPDLSPRFQSAPLNYDPPDHAPLRAPLNKVFTPSQMHLRVDQIHGLAAELIDRVVPLGRADFFAEVTERLPVLIFIDIMGLNRADYAYYRELAKAATGEPDQEIRTTAIGKGLVLLSEVIAERRENPQDDLISYIVALEIGGEPIDDTLALGYCKLLFFAGLDTVANAMAFCMHYLAKDQGLQQRLRDQPDKIPHAMEELLRRHSVAPVIRTVMKDEEWRGFNVRKGDMLVLNYPVANIDERVFENADKVDVDRERINHIAFGSGIHRCVGRHLARIEIVALLEEVMKRLPTFRLDPDKMVPMRGGSVWSIPELPLVWDDA